MSNRRPVWLLDVDGVVNAPRPGWGGPPHRDVAYAGGLRFTIRWAPALAKRLRALIAAGTAEVRWCTTWCPYADQIERLLRLPPLDRCWTEDIAGAAAAEAKVGAARRVLAEGRRLIWTDDVEVPEDGPLYEELTATGAALLIRPLTSRGLQPHHLEAIEAFCAVSEQLNGVLEAKVREEAQMGEPRTDQEEYDPVTADQVARQPQEGQVLGRSVPTPEKVTRAEPGSPETGARRDESGQPVAE